MIFIPFYILRLRKRWCEVYLKKELKLKERSHHVSTWNRYESLHWTGELARPSGKVTGMNAHWFDSYR